MKKGFTLIELLAVIVILAVIALIATPIILGIIEDTRKSSKDESVKLYLDTLKKSIAIELTADTFKDIKLVKCIIQNDGSTICNNSKVNIEIDNNPLIGGNIILDNGKITSAKAIKFKNDDNVYKFENNTLVPIDICFYTSLNDDNTLSIAGYNSECGTDVVIPSSLPLTSIESLDTEACINKLVATGFSLDQATKTCKIDNDNLIWILNIFDVAKFSKSDENYQISKIGESAFQSKNLSSVTIQNGINTIDMYAFLQNNLTSVSIPDSVTSIGSGAFDYNSITSVDIGSGIKSVKGRAFGGDTSDGYGPNKIESVTINTTKDKVTIDSTSFNWVFGKSNEDIKWAE